MKYEIPLHPAIDLHVPAKISREDAERQMRTAREILARMDDRAGLILADEVGMGKTFVALAVAASVALHGSHKAPVAVIVPSSVKDKWPRDFEIFRESCVSSEVAGKLRYGIASRAVEFLKFLDDPPSRRKAIVFVTHGAMSRNLADPFVKFALLRRALKYRRDANRVRTALTRFAGPLLQAGWMERRAPDLWERLLRRHPRHWREVLERVEIDRPNDKTPLSADDPVPEPFLAVLPELNTDALFQALCNIPRYRNQTFNARIKQARQEINAALRVAWKEAVSRMRIRMPLVVLDEAHHAKNAGTQLASLFEAKDAEEDADELSGGALGGAFERMLFLTATPFQLGHHELCNVLERFEGIDWESRRAPVGGRTRFRDDIEQLRQSLDASQEAAVRLEETWSRLRPEDLQAGGQLFDDPERWWLAALGAEELTERGEQALARVRYTQEMLGEAETLLRDWVIRHTRPKLLPAPNDDVARRCQITGEGICTGVVRDGTDGAFLPGIPVQGDSALPFLLAARLVACTPESRPVFSEGLASSYEAFLKTRAGPESGESTVDEEDSLPRWSEPGAAAKWYLDRIEEVVNPRRDGRRQLDHPKLAATTERAIQLWRQGEKVLIFVHYIATGRALRESISEAVLGEFRAGAAKQLGLREEQVFDELERIANRLDKGEPAAGACNRQVDRLLEGFPELARDASRVHDVVLRFLRRPSFIVRYFDLTDWAITPGEVDEAFDTPDASGLTFRDVVRNFLAFLAHRCSAADREAYLQAVETIQTGAHYAGDAVDADTGHAGRRKFVGNVRLINGATKPETRERLMLAFNTPFYPEIMISSSVMAEGVDLHLNCRHIIHHDLAWNPSNLEQRTGRVDRIGAKAENAGRPINIYMPYIAETQDEKMFRVVMDRDRWFNVVMGGRVVNDAQEAERIAERVPLPEAAKEALMLDLSVK